ncbi:hypothetical protein [Legionella yabuuchiae]|uniref:hypothetical protein n=1 Tax=Legionella yabuuchiae TaxID=376727 RepID=UPI001056D989|nr:hypothetical protein [Legionella yabuuchiae]
MDFLFVNTRELSALIGLPYIQQSAYLIGVRPFMDRQTGFVGIKRRISYQSLAEALYIEPHPGVQSGSPSKQQLRRVIKSLERSGLIAIHSNSKHLVLQCLLADGNYSVQNKADTIPTPQADTKPESKSKEKSDGYGSCHQKGDTGLNAKADIPHNSVNNCVYVRDQFEKFWTLYPQKKNRGQAFDVFVKLNPSEDLFKQIITAIQAQIKNHHELVAAGHWVPKWKYPANWLLQQCWLEEIETIVTKEQQNAKSRSNRQRKTSADILSESCREASFDFEEESKSPDNVIQFGRKRNL